jgi:hypothetical protein
MSWAWSVIPKWSLICVLIPLATDEPIAELITINMPVRTMQIFLADEKQYGLVGSLWPNCSTFLLSSPGLSWLPVQSLFVSVGDVRPEMSPELSAASRSSCLSISFLLISSRVVVRERVRIRSRGMWERLWFSVDSGASRLVFHDKVVIRSSGISLFLEIVCDSFWLLPVVAML